MNSTAIFWPMIAHVALVYIVFGVLRLRRTEAVRTGAASPATWKARGAEPAVSTAANNNLLNQFELPLLFHVCCLALFVTNGANYLLLALAWIFVASRYLHAFVHLTGNSIRWRAGVFIVGTVILFLMWVLFALHIAGVA